MISEDCDQRQGEGASAAERINEIRLLRLSERLLIDLPDGSSVFRPFLANGNQPLDVEELGQRLNEWRGADAYRTSSEVLPRILENERYYGLRRVE